MTHDLLRITHKAVGYNKQIVNSSLTRFCVFLSLKKREKSLILFSLIHSKPSGLFLQFTVELIQNIPHEITFEKFP